MFMPLLIDGYNLMYAAGVIATGHARTSLERSRVALLNFVAEHVDIPAERYVTVVFDAANGPKDLPARTFFRGLDVRFAKSYPDADALLEKIIAIDSTPRQLTVVSSDHRVQRAAKRRRCRTVDSEIWCGRVRKAKRKQLQAPVAHEPQPEPADPGVDYWLAQFQAAVSEAEHAPLDEQLAPFSQEYLDSLASEFDAPEEPNKPIRRRRPRPGGT